ncbi:hypothetical protein HS088_TW04G00457 [Tripterygium wilfordii]|uniref:Uncharacterized protein n=1 Tax=Tripterygium wilfordii TaxID=458696 RepID=A0A7J7DQ27_TRIWF|nr:uncharacterized protein LOC119997949 [Tripterygium wilfordii]KAF5748502.1 hypothetical protein HS088_TW04G00457 [Tripterygium wilfordii]
MALARIERMKLANPDILIGENYDTALQLLIRELLDEIQSNASDFSGFIDRFYELIQARIDPPLESIWVYSALTFRSRKISDEDLSSRVLAAKDLFQFISSCSSSCSSAKSIALLAPVVLETYKLVVELLGRELGSKREKKAKRVVKSLIDGILGNISICCGGDLSEDNDSDLIVGFADLVRLWIDSKNLVSFFPLVSSDIIRREVGMEGCDTDCLAIMVMVQAFLLKLCLNLRLGFEGLESENELRNWVVTSINGFKRISFFENLVRMLLEATFPATSLVSSEIGVLLRRILYDAVIMVDYSFLKPERSVQLPAEHVKSLSLSRLIITHEAIEFFRNNGDLRRAISYTGAFSSSQLPSQIIKLVTGQVGMQEEASRLDGSSPKGLLKWLINLEDQGVRVFDDVLKHHAYSVVNNAESEDTVPSSEVDKKKVNEELLFYIDKGEEKDGDEDEGDKETNESMSAAFIAATHTMKLRADRSSKRKDGGSSKTKKNKKIKYQPHDIHDGPDSMRPGLLSAGDDDSNSESEVENPLSDDNA